MAASALKKFLVGKIAFLIIILGVFVAVAIARYLSINKYSEASQCIHNQVVVETALAIAYAESLAVGSNQYPDELSPSMFEDGIIPVCPIDHSPIAYDKETGTSFCPNHIMTHQRNF
ncbi:MAG: hypothetical protein V2J62_10235 [candidate division KSB1 bacterium]|jgi:hypothetical protein|nr:hypothetical protein [candidate division KSB1 bacterium]